MENMLMAFNANRKVTYDILDVLTEEELIQKWDRPGLDTFSKHFQEMAAVTDAYAEAFVHGNMDFSNVPDVFGFIDILDKNELRRLLRDSDAKLKNIVEEKKYKDQVFWFDMSLSADLHFTNIISHEVFHQGMMTMFLYQNHIDLPLSLMDNWSLPETE